MPDRRLVRLLPWGGGVAGVLAIVAAVVLRPENPYAAVWTAPFLATYAAGLWACRAEPENRAAWWLLGFGSIALTWCAASWALALRVYDAGESPGLLPAQVLVEALGLAMAAALVGLLVRYPDGVHRLRVETWLLRAVAALVVLVPLALLLGRPEATPPWILEWAGDSGGLSVAPLDSPWYVPGLAWLSGPAGFLHDSALDVAPALGLLVAVARFRLLDRTQRGRMAWPMQAALVVVIVAVADHLVLDDVLPTLVVNVVDAICLLLLPVSLGIGIARPSLFDALGAVRRTVGYTLLSTAIVGVYVAAAGVMGAAVGRDNLQVAVVVAVLASLALDPVRRLLVRKAGHLAYGERVTRDELLRRLGATLEHTLDRNELSRTVATTAREGLGAEWVRLRVTGEPEVLVGRAPRPDETPVATAALRHGSDDLGVVECGPLVRGRVDQHTRSLLDTLAHQAALALTNARLAERLVTAEETARRRLERDLHDGAQQDLAALLARIGLARNQLTRGDPERVSETLDTLHGDARHALANLRELASGIHTTVLADRGLVEAIETRVARLPIPVDVIAGAGVRDGRLADSVAGAAYFTVCEALANVLKHADADRVAITLGLDAGTLRIEVADDGVGLDPARRTGSGGLAGLADRLAALGGTLAVGPRPGGGTTLTAAVPTQP